MGFTSNIFLFACIFTGHCSSSFQACVPKSRSRHTVLDLSQKNISELHFSDFSSLPELQVLNLSHNLLRDLDFSVFKFSKKLVCLDLSHNNLRNIFCQTLAGLRHLDLSFNKFKTLPICQEFGSMLNLDYLGLSATMIQKSDFKDITHLQLRTVFITLEDLFHYESKSLTVLNTKNLQIVYPTNQNFIFPLLYDGMSTSEELELSNIQYNSTDFPLPSFDTLQKFKTINMRFNNVDLSWSTILRISVIVWCTPVEYFTVKNLTFWGSIQTHIDFSFLLSDWAQFVYLGSSMKALTLKHIRTKIFSFSQEILYRTFSELSIENLTISDAYMPHMLCPSKTSLFQYLDFSHNALTDELFKNCDTLTHLKMFILRRNQLENLSKVSSMTSKMKSLKHLDISSNLLYYDDNNDDEDENHCNWVGNLAKLNLSSNKLTDSVFGCLPINVQILDLQNNQIRTIPKDVTELKALKELNIAFNGLTELPGCSHFRGLEFLNIEENSILSPSSDFFHSCQNIRELRGGHNPFQCSCELRDFINFEKKSGRRLIGWPESYVCEYPDGLKGTQLKDFHLSELSCNTTLLLIIAVVVTVLVVAVTSFLCIYFDIMWYLKMMWQWAQTKHRVRNSHPEDLQNVLQFHAFISYSERDSLWVQSHLIPNLEKEDGSVQICLHERNFVPGKSIVENIINCIEKSHKSIFVLSPNFVQSEWCHYELYFAHHKLFSESSNSLILILLEPIPQYLIPARYHKLKALMAKRTYLEWPKEKSKHGLFWSNLKAAININLPVSREMVVV